MVIHQIHNHLYINSGSLYRVNQILNFIPIGKSTWWLWVKTGKAPKPIKLSSKISAWRGEDLLKLIEELEA
ncbi:MAG: AlpA family phage regulatory protein [Cytophagia bacterium]|nr:AlpA family phage regulatory protein [Cytophagia bacterium]